MAEFTDQWGGVTASCAVVVQYELPVNRPGGTACRLFAESSRMLGPNYFEAALNKHTGVKDWEGPNVAGTYTVTVWGSDVARALALVHQLAIKAWQRTDAKEQREEQRV